VITAIPSERCVEELYSKATGNRLEVSCDTVPEPVAVRYGWSNLPPGGLMNARERPAYPFRSDTWPLIPHQSAGAYDVENTGFLRGAQ